MIRWDPARDLMSLKQAVDKLLEESLIRPPGFTIEIGKGDIPVDVYQTDRDFVIKATLPGINSDDTEISTAGDVLIIKAERKEEKEIKDKNYIRKENHYGMLSRSFKLPTGLDTEKAEASFDNGILTLTLPRLEKSISRKIKIFPKTNNPNESH
jgi:HSP20 family protein